MTLSKQLYLIQEEHYSSSHETHCMPYRNDAYQLAIYDKLYINYNLNNSTKLN